MQLRRFNTKGIEFFREALAVCRDNQNADIPGELLNSNELTSIVSPSIEVHPQAFKTKRDAARYFHETFLSLSREQLLNDAGLWSWLSLLNFDVICPRVNEHRKIRNDYTYIFEPKNSRNYYRHLLFVSWYIQNIAPSFNRLMLNSSVSTLDKFTSEVTKRLYLTRIPCFFEVLDRLYWDESLGRARPGVTNFAKVTAGNLAHRLPIRIRQLEKTYDLQSLTADQLIELLGEEFCFDAASKHKQLLLSVIED
jgi:hypothetical protein